MSRGRFRKLEGEDRILWEQVERTTVPLKGRKLERRQPPQQPPADAPEPKAPARNTGGAAAPPPPEKKSQPRLTRLDSPTRNKLARGRLPVQARIDLHGMTQGEAHPLLLSFLRRAQAAGLRHVLVITGKGSTGDGVLRRAVPGWLVTPAFRALVSGIDEAGRRHGGGGALYVRLRRPESHGS